MLRQTANRTAGRTARRTASATLVGLLVSAGCAHSVLAQEAAPALEASSDDIEISAFTEPVDLAVLVEFVAEELGIDITVQGELDGQVSFVRPRTIPREDVLPLLERLLDQNDFSLMYDELLDRYMIRAGQSVAGGGAGSDFATTRIIQTPNMRPTALQPAIDAYSTGVGGVGQISYLDDLGLVVVTGPPIRARELEAYIQSLTENARRIDYIRFQLKHISATAARERAIALATGSTGIGLQIGNNPGNNNNAQIGRSQSVDNLADRLVVEPHSNALILRGFPDEAERVRRVIELIDQPTDLEPKEFFAGSLAAQVARIASGLGLGEVIEIDEDNQGNQFNNLNRNRNLQAQLNQALSTDLSGGSRIVVDAERGKIIHYGTPEQQVQLGRLVAELKADGERIVIREYKLENATAETVADLLQALVDGGNDQTDGSLLPGTSRPNQVNRAQANALAQGEGAFTAQAEDVYVGFYEPQNMVLVKAPAEVQSQFQDLIDRLDQRTPQVYLEVQIVSVTNTENFRLAVESQLIAGQFGLQTNNGLSTAGDDFLDPRSPVSTLSGLTSALIRSDSLPFVINAIQTDTDAKVISKPSLLVNDNAEATIVSQEQQPTTTTSQGGDSTVTSFDGFEEAGTSLTVRPIISSGGYVRLEYEIELSNFIGTGGNGIPAPRNVRNVDADSVTIPSDTTIVVGGINVSDIREEQTGIPILKDIPILGYAFSDTTEISSDSLLYIFITPRIMRDDNFRDLRLLTAGPQSEVEIEEDLPDLRPVFMESLDLSARPQQDRSAAPGQPRIEPPVEAPAEAPVDEPAGESVESPAAMPRETGRMTPIEPGARRDEASNSGGGG